MSNRTRALIIGATLAAMNLAGMTAVAQANADDQPALRPPTEGQVGEAWRHRHVTSPEQAAADTAQRRQQAQEQSYNPTATPAPAPPESRGQPGWLVASIGVLVAVLALAGGLVVVAARRASRRARLEHAA
jgi:hypothetical protein